MVNFAWLTFVDLSKLTVSGPSVDRPNTHLFLVLTNARVANPFSRGLFNRKANVALTKMVRSVLRGEGAKAGRAWRGQRVSTQKGLRHGKTYQGGKVVAELSKSEYTEVGVGAGSVEMRRM